MVLQIDVEKSLCKSRSVRVCGQDFWCEQDTTGGNGLPSNQPEYGINERCLIHHAGALPNAPETTSTMRPVRRDKGDRDGTTSFLCF